MSVERLDSLFRTMARRSFESAFEFSEFAVPEFSHRLGYDPSKLYYEVTLPSSFTGGVCVADATVGVAPDRRPWLAIDVEYVREDAAYVGDEGGHDFKADEYGVRNYLDRRLSTLLSTGAERAVVLSNVAVLAGRTAEGDTSVHETLIIDLANPGDSDLETLADWFDPPPSFPEEGLDWDVSEGDVIEGPFFELDVEELRGHRAAADADDDNEKGDAYEHVAALLLESITCLRVRELGMDNLTGQIDVIAEYVGSDGYPLFEDFGRFVLVECKNWDKSVSSGQISKFADKIAESRLDLGIVFARNGISGEDDGVYARRRVHNLFQRDGIAILVITDGDLDRVTAGESFYDVLEEKLYRLRFQLG